MSLSLNPSCCCLSVRCCVLKCSITPTQKIYWANRALLFTNKGWAWEFGRDPALFVLKAQLRCLSLHYKPASQSHPGIVHEVFVFFFFLFEDSTSSYNTQYRVIACVQLVNIIWPKPKRQSLTIVNHKKAMIHDFSENPGCGSVIYAFMLFFVVVVDVLIFVPKSDNSSTGCVYIFTWGP